MITELLLSRKCKKIYNILNKGIESFYKGTMPVGEFKNALNISLV